MGVDKNPNPQNPTPTNPTPHNPTSHDSTAHDSTAKDKRAIFVDPDDPLVKASAEPPKDTEMRKWLKDEAWKQPKWLKNTKSERPKSVGFESFYLNSLRARYVHLEGDFRTAYNNFYGTPYMDLVSAKLIINYLQTSKECLENDDCDVTNIITMLDLTDQSMVAIYPPHHAKAQASGLASELKGQTDPATQAWGIYLEKELCRDGQTLGGIRAALMKTKEAINEAKQGSIISTGLQIERLTLARKWSWYVLGLSLVLLPFVLKIDAKLWEDAQLMKAMAIDAKAFPWILMFTAGAFGAVGAFFSNLLSIQNTKTKLTDFQESLKNSLLKLNIGALAAMIMFTFLTWQIIPGVTLVNAGSLIFLAFIAGFSERFFLNLLNIDNETIAPRPAPADIAAVPPTAVGDNVNTEPVN